MHWFALNEYTDNWLAEALCAYRYLVSDVVFSTEIAVVTQRQERINDKCFVTISHRVEIDVVVIRYAKEKQTTRMISD